LGAGQDAYQSLDVEESGAARSTGDSCTTENELDGRRSWPRPGIATLINLKGQSRAGVYFRTRHGVDNFIWRWLCSGNNELDGIRREYRVWRPKKSAFRWRALKEGGGVERCRLAGRKCLRSWLAGGIFKAIVNSAPVFHISSAWLREEVFLVASQEVGLRKMGARQAVYEGQRRIHSL